MVQFPATSPARTESPVFSMSQVDRSLSEVRFLTVAEVAEVMRVSKMTVYRLVHAGEILIGQHTPFSAANFVIGCPASLPTNGFARVTSGVTVDAFLKRTAVARADEEALRRLAPSVIALADVEGFPAHANAIRIRFS